MMGQNPDDYTPAGGKSRRHGGRGKSPRFADKDEEDEEDDGALPPYKELLELPCMFVVSPSTFRPARVINANAPEEYVGIEVMMRARRPRLPST